MRRWVWATVSAVVAGFAVMLLDLGVVVWSALISAGVLTVATCPDTVAVPTAAPLCVRPTSLMLVHGATVVAVALFAGFVAYRAAERRSLAARHRTS